MFCDDDDDDDDDERRGGGEREYENHALGRGDSPRAPTADRDRNVAVTVGGRVPVVFEMVFLFFVVSATKRTFDDDARRGRRGQNRRELPFALTSSHAGASNANEMAREASISDNDGGEPAVRIKVRHGGRRGRRRRARISSH